MIKLELERFEQMTEEEKQKLPSSLLLKIGYARLEREKEGEENEK
ncbi:hypothetical protein [Bacillus haikouensis]|nr:hypothetical protein [Bacillus haikouensis]